MAFHDAANDRQAYACAFKVFRPVQSLKNLKQLILVLHVEAGAVIADEHREHFAFLVILATDQNLWFGNFAGILDGIGEQVHQHLMKQRDIAFDFGQVSYVPLHTARVRFAGLEISANSCHQFRQFNLVFLHFDPAEP